MTDAEILDRVLVDDGCWRYTQIHSDKPLKPNTYGYFPIMRNTRMAHREVYRILVGPIPAGKMLHHTCQNPACVRPDHLQPVTYSEHGFIHKPRFVAETCPHGHSEWSYRDERTRYCRACARARMRKLRSR